MGQHPGVTRRDVVAVALDAVGQCRFLFLEKHRGEEVPVAFAPRLDMHEGHRFGVVHRSGAKREIH
ncbi:hypothetical protein D3C78_1908720 [compost metagenome]